MDLLELYAWDESKHPRDATGRFSTKQGASGGALSGGGDFADAVMKSLGKPAAQSNGSEFGDAVLKSLGMRVPPKAGDTFEIAEGVPNTSSWNKLKILDVVDGKASIGYAEDENGYTWATIPLGAPLDHFMDDVGGKVTLDKPTDDHRIQAVADGKAKFLGKGNDGLVFDVGDEVVKVSTAVPYHWTNTKHFVPEPYAGVAKLKKEVEINEELRAKGVPGLLPQQFKQVGGKGFSFKPKLTMTDKFSLQQLEQIKDAITGMHENGYTIGDQVQAGIGADGNAYLFDLGAASKFKDERQKDYALEDDRGSVRRLYQEAGHEPPYWPDEVVNKWNFLQGQAERFVEKIKEGRNVPPGMVSRTIDEFGKAFEQVQKVDPDFVEWIEDEHQELMGHLTAYKPHEDPAKYQAADLLQQA